jgi:hypothetical protein
VRTEKRGLSAEAGEGRVAGGGEDGGEVGLWDGGGELLGYVAFVLEGQGEGADAEAGFKGVVKRQC